MHRFPHSNLRVYTAARAFFGEAAAVAACLPANRAWFGDQLLRAAGSILLNIAEGSAEFSPKDKARFYRFALRSASECAAALDLLLEMQLVDSAKADAGHASLDEIISMLTGLAKRLSG